MVMRVGLLFGGRSGEHEVSIRSAGSIARALSSGNNAEKYEVVPVYIGKDGSWMSGGVAQQVLETARPLMDETEEKAEENAGKSLKSKAGDRAGLATLIKRLPDLANIGSIDIWFPVLHGPNGEDGTVQGLFEVLQVPYVGCGVLGSALGMDKLAMKSAFAQAGLPQVKYRGVSRAEIYSNP